MISQITLSSPTKEDLLISVIVKTTTLSAKMPSTLSQSSTCRIKLWTRCGELVTLVQACEEDKAYPCKTSTSPTLCSWLQETTCLNRLTPVTCLWNPTQRWVVWWRCTVAQTLDSLETRWHSLRIKLAPETDRKGASNLRPCSNLVTFGRDPPVFTWKIHTSESKTVKSYIKQEKIKQNGEWNESYKQSKILNICAKLSSASTVN